MLQTPAAKFKQCVPTELQTPPVECQPPVETILQRVQRQAKAQRQKKVKVSAVVGEARAARFQEMIAAHEQGLQRLRMGRKRALESARVFARIRQRAALEYAETKENTRQMILHFQEKQRTKHRELQEWVESVTKASRETWGKLRETSKMKASVDTNENVGRPELADPAPQCAKQDGAESSSKAVLLGKKPEEEGRGLSQSDTSCSGNVGTVEKTLKQTNAAGVACRQNEQVWKSFKPFSPYKYCI